MFVIDEQPMFRLGLTAALAAHAGIEIAGDGHHFADAIATAERVPVDCVLLGASGHVRDTPVLDHVQALRTSIPKACVVLLIDPMDEAGRNRARLAGVGGILTRTSSSDEVVQAALATRHGFHHPFSQSQSRNRSTRAGDDLGTDLTERETDLLQLMAMA